MEQIKHVSQSVTVLTKITLSKMIITNIHLYISYDHLKQNKTKQNI